LVVELVGDGGDPAVPASDRLPGKDAPGAGIVGACLAVRARQAGQRRFEDSPALMAGRAETKAVVTEFLARQREMYAGKDLDSVEALLAEDVVWHVPGTSPIAGDYHGRDAVIGYFRRRRELAGGSITVTRSNDAHHDEALVQLADGRASLG
jgi:ketosteroid isomerase-like protein